MPPDPTALLEAAKQYATVVADPPWTPSMSVINGGAPKASPQRQYRTLSLAEIVSIAPPLLPQAHVYIWAIAQHVDWAYDVCRAWGAEPIILWTWEKPGLGVGRFRCNSEHVLVGRKGSRHGMPFGNGGRHAQATAGTVFRWPRGRHSEKPDAFYALVESLSPRPRLDMYARRPRAGWDVFGDECENA